MEDRNDNRYVIQEILEKTGCTVTVVGQGKEALRKLEDCKGKYDIILMDCQMPQMDGYEVTKIIRSKSWGKKIPVIALTAYAMQGDREKCLEAGMNDYLSKPVKMSDIQKILEKYSPVSS